MSETEVVGVGFPALALQGDERLLAGLLAGLSVRDAAAEAGLSRATADRRLGDERFRGRLDSARRALTSALAVRLAESAAEAHDVLREVMRNGGFVRRIGPDHEYQVDGGLVVRTTSRERPMMSRRTEEREPRGLDLDL